MENAARMQSDLVPIEDPDFYTGSPWPAFARMQEEDGLYYYEPLDLFVATRHKDIRDLTIRSEFIAAKGIFLADRKYRGQTGDSTMTDSFFPKGGEQVGTSDGARQQELRRVIAPALSIPAMEAIRPALEQHLAEDLAKIAPGQVIDWVGHASSLPIAMACNLIGLPTTDHAQVQIWSDQLEALGGDLTYEQIAQTAKDFQTLQAYIVENVAIRKIRPIEGGLDLLSVLLNAEMDDKPVSMANVVMFAMTAMAAGSDTTRALLAGTVHCLAQHPEQWTLLRENRSLVDNAIEEVLRWVTPARAFMRVAATDAEFNGQTIRADQGVYFMYMAANRDASVFENPLTFDVTRSNASRHLAFGAGPHLCAGMRLARLEGRMMLNALLDRFSGVELAGPAVPVRHIIRNSWSTMPVAFKA